MLFRSKRQVTDFSFSHNSFFCFLDEYWYLSKNSKNHDGSAHKNHPRVDPNLIKCSSLHLDEDSTQLANDCSHVHAKPSLTAKLIHQRTGRIITSQQVNSIRSKQKQLEDLTDTLDDSQTSAEKLLECLNSAERISYMALFHDPTSSLLTDSNAPCPKPKKKKGNRLSGFP